MISNHHLIAYQRQMLHQDGISKYDVSLVRVSNFKSFKKLFEHFHFNVVDLRSVPRGRWSQLRRGRKVEGTKS
jgi:hypothetical protein